MTRVVVIFALVILGLQSSQAQAVDTFRAELEQYALNHTRQELQSYALARIQQMNCEALQPAFSFNGVLLSDSLIAQLEDEDVNSIAPELLGLRALWSSCRYTYTSDLLTSTTIAAEAIAALSDVSLSDFLTCTSGSLAAHAALIAAARDRRIACWESALAGCRPE